MDNTTAMHPPRDDRLIITAASENFGRSLLALLGSLNLNWPDHPPVQVYDIGLDAQTLDSLRRNDISVIRVPPFVAHWRKHYTWKLWCLLDAPARDILWLDAGVAVLQPLNEIFDALDARGYFVTPNYRLLDWEASLDACAGCGVLPDFRLGKASIAANIMGYRKEGAVLELLREALEVAWTEKHIMATEPSHRHDQAILSLLLHKHFGPLLFADGQLYHGDRLPNQPIGKQRNTLLFQSPLQRAWAHRRKLDAADIDYLAAHIRAPESSARGSRPPRFIPRNPLAAWERSLTGQIHRWLVRLLRVLEDPGLLRRMWHNKIHGRSVNQGIKD